MKKIANRFSIFTTISILSLAVISACSSAEKTNIENKNAIVKTEQSNAAANEKANAENKATENKALSDEAAKMQVDGLPELNKGEDYKKSVREKMLKAGWKPARSEQADFCGSVETVCDEFDEYESYTEKNLTSFRWQKGSKFVEILTTGKKSYVYDSYEFEKNSMTVAENERWEKFWTEFKSAFDKKDTKNLRRMMADHITGGGDDSETAEQRIAAMQNNWDDFKKIVDGGTIKGDCEKLCRTTKDGYMIFEYKDVYWEWTSLGGEGGED